MLMIVYTNFSKIAKKPFRAFQGLQKFFSFDRDNWEIERAVWIFFVKSPKRGKNPTPPYTHPTHLNV